VTVAANPSLESAQVFRAQKPFIPLFEDEIDPGKHPVAVIGQRSSHG